MRELKVVGLDVDGKRIICESDGPARSSSCAPTTGCVPPCAATRPVSAKPNPTSRSQACCVPRRFRPGSARAHPSSRSPQAAGVDIVAGRAVRPSGVAGALPRRRAGNRRPSGARRRARGADAAGDGDDGAGRPRPGPRRHQLGRVAQRGRPLDGAAGVEGRTVRQRRALPVHARRARRHRRPRSTTPPAS